MSPNAHGFSEPATIVVQVDGRQRTRLEVDATATEAEVLRAAALAAGGIDASRMVFVPGRLVNLVT